MFSFHDNDLHLPRRSRIQTWLDCEHQMCHRAPHSPGLFVCIILLIPLMAFGVFFDHVNLVCWKPVHLLYVPLGERGLVLWVCPPIVRFTARLGYQLLLAVADQARFGRPPYLGVACLYKGSPSPIFCTLQSSSSPPPA